MTNKTFYNLNPKKLIEDVKTVARLHEAGKTVDEIAAEVGQSKSVVRRWIEQVIIPAMKVSKAVKK